MLFYGTDHDEKPGEKKGVRDLNLHYLEISTYKFDVIALSRTYKKFT